METFLRPMELLLNQVSLSLFFLGGGTRGEGRMILGTLFRHIYQG